MATKESILQFECTIISEECDQKELLPLKVDSAILHVWRCSTFILATAKKCIAITTGVPSGVKFLLSEFFPREWKI